MNDETLIFTNEYGSWPTKIKITQSKLYKYHQWCSKNLGQLGDRWYWSRHMNCRDFIIFFKHESDYAWFVLGCGGIDA